MFLKLLLDLLIIGILVLGSYYGYTRGLFRIISRPVRFLVCLGVSFWLCSFVGDVILSPLVEGPISSYIRELVYDKCLGLAPTEAIEEMPTLLKIAAAAFDIGIDLDADTVGDATEQIIASLSVPTVRIVSRIVAFLLLLLLSRLAVGLLIELLDTVVSLGIIGSLNRLLGLLLSWVFAVIIAWAFAAGVDFLLHSSLLSGVEVIDGFDGGLIFSFFVSFSPIRLLFSF